MKKAKFGLFLLAVALLLMGYALWVILSTPGMLQYVTLPDAESAQMARQATGEAPPTQLKQRIDAFEELTRPELAETMRAVALSGAAPQITITTEVGGNNIGTSAGLIAVGKGYFQVYPQLLHTGRLPHAEELERGDRVMLLDEQIAIELFRMVDIFEREVTFQGEVYRVIGVVRHTKRVGDAADAHVYVPLAALAKGGDHPLQTLGMSALPAQGGGALNAFKEATAGWKAGGGLYDLRKERVGATIWARYLGCGVGFALLGWLISRYVQSIAGLHRSMGEKLKDQYMTRLLPYLAGHILLRLLALAMLAGLAALLMNLLLEPVNVYPEYVPAVLVEPREIVTTFWGLRRMQSAAVVLRTPQIVRLAYFGGLCRTAVILALAGGCLVLWKRGNAR